MSLSTEQQQFTRMIASLINYATMLGYGLTLSRGYASPEANVADGGHERSLHLKRLAQDFNVFKDGEYLQGSAANTAHNMLHDHFDAIGGAERIINDLNHYSLEYQGMR